MTKNIYYFNKKDSFNKLNAMKTYAYILYKNVYCIENFIILFFSHQNVEEIQKRLRYEVYKLTDFLIGKQNKTLLLQEMKLVFDTRGHIPQKECHYKKEIQILNDILVSKLSKNIHTNVLQQLKYLKDTDISNRDFIPTPQITSIKNRVRTTDIGIDQEEFFKIE